MKKLILMAAMLLTACSAQQAREAASNRESARIHTELGAGYYQQDQMGIALEEFTEATKIDPGYALAYNGLGLVYGKLGEDAKADASFKKSLQKALQIQPLLHQAAYQLALIQFNRGEHEQARKSLVNALVSNPTADTLW